MKCFNVEKVAESIGAFFLYLLSFVAVVFLFGPIEYPKAYRGVVLEEHFSLMALTPVFLVGNFFLTHTPPFFLYILSDRLRDTRISW